MMLRISSCRTCGDPITFGRGRQGGWVPCEPESVSERVDAEDGGFHFEPKLGHRRHDCTPRGGVRPPPAREMGGTAGLDAENWLDGIPGGTRHEDLRRALEHARSAIDSALEALDGGRHVAH